MQLLFFVRFTLVRRWFQFYGNHMQHLDTLQDLLTLKLQILYDVEHKLLKFVPTVATKLKNPRLKTIVKQRAQEIPKEIEKLKKIFNRLGLKPTKIQSAGIRGIIQDAKWLFTVPASAEARDAGLIAALQYMEHYEITACGTAYAWAKELGLTTISNELDQTEKEEFEVDKALTEIAEHEVNKQAE